MQTQDPSAHTSPLLIPMIIAGILAGTVGLVIGGLIGATTCDWSLNEARCLEPTVYGGIIGESVLLPLGACLIGRPRGGLPTFLFVLTVSVGIGGVGLALAFATGLPAVLSPVPVLQLIACVAIQKRTTRSH